MESRVTKGSFLGRRVGVNASRIHMFERNWEGGGSQSRCTTFGEASGSCSPARSKSRSPVPRRLYLKQSDFMAHGTTDRCPGCRALISGGQAQGHTEECRIRVEGELRKTKEEKACLRAAACRVGDASTGRALKRVRFAEGGTTTVLRCWSPYQNQHRQTFPLKPRRPVLLPHPRPRRHPPASAIGARDQVMSEGASSAPDATARLSMKRSSDSSQSESETKRHHTDHSTRDVVMLLDDSDVSRAVEQCREVCRRKETFLVDVNDWD